MNAVATIWRADQPLARCANCGAAKQFHGRLNFGCANFRAETAWDLDPVYLNDRDLLRHCREVGGDDAALTLAGGEPSDADMAESDRLDARLCACRAEIEDRLTRRFGAGFDDLRLAMGW